jgi:hypothetical protein
MSQKNRRVKKRVLRKWKGREQKENKKGAHAHMQQSRFCSGTMQDGMQRMNQEEPVQLYSPAHLLQKKYIRVDEDIGKMGRSGPNGLVVSRHPSRRLSLTTL